MSIDNTIQVLECVLNDTQIDAPLLQESDVQETLRAYYAEKHARPEMVEQIPWGDTLTEYLQLPISSREGVDRFRRKYPEYVAGSLEANAPNSLPMNLKLLQEFLFLIHQRKALTHIVQTYIQYQPTSPKGTVPLTAWFKRYDITTGRSLYIKRELVGNPQGNKYYAYYQKLDTRLTFDQWILQHLTSELQQQLQHTHHYQRTEHTIEDIITAYIQHQPTSQHGPVPLTNWFTSYNIITGQNLKEQKKGKRTTTGTPQGNKYYERYKALNTNQIFEQWTLSQLSPELQEQLQHTSYFQKNEYTIEDIIRTYVQQHPTSRNGPVPLQAWFTHYDITTGQNVLVKRNGKTTRTGTSQGRKYHRRFKTSKTNQTFNQWILQQVSPALQKRLRDTPYFQQNEYTIEDIITAYIQHQPTSQHGPVPLQAYFQNYDITTGRNLQAQKNGNKIHNGTAQGNKFYQRYKKLSTDHTFGQWILEQVDDELQTQLSETAYFQEKYGGAA